MGKRKYKPLEFTRKVRGPLLRPIYRKRVEQPDCYLMIFPGDIALEIKFKAMYGVKIRHFKFNHNRETKLQKMLMRDFKIVQARARLIIQGFFVTKLTKNKNEKLSRNVSDGSATAGLSNTSGIPIRRYRMRDTNSEARKELLQAQQQTT